MVFQIVLIINNKKGGMMELGYIPASEGIKRCDE